jgi:hypothetical protein
MVISLRRVELLARFDYRDKRRGKYLRAAEVGAEASTDTQQRRAG